jgi:hypothetical protein
MRQWQWKGRLEPIRNVQAGSWKRGCLQPTRKPSRAILVPSCWPRNYFNQCLVSNWKWKTIIIGHKWTSVTSQTMLFNSIYICHIVKIDLKTSESNCNLKNYLADSRFVPPIDRLTFPPIVGGNFFQDGSKPMSREILYYLVHRSRKNISRDQNGLPYIEGLGIQYVTGHFPHENITFVLPHCHMCH